MRSYGAPSWIENVQQLIANERPKIARAPLPTAKPPHESVNACAPLFPIPLSRSPQIVRWLPAVTEAAPSRSGQQLVP
jgi:hypothetical protein